MSLLREIGSTPVAFIGGNEVVSPFALESLGETADDCDKGTGTDCCRFTLELVIVPLLETARLFACVIASDAIVSQVLEADTESSGD